MTDAQPLDALGDAADLLESAASVHEAEGRSSLAKHHRRAAARLRPAVPAAA